MDRIERGALLKKLRESKNEKQSDIAKIIGVTQQAYQRYENGTSEPNADGLITLANHFNVTVDYLLGRAEKNDPLSMLNISAGEKDAMAKYVLLPESTRQIIIDVMIQLAEAAKGKEKPPVFIFRRFATNKASAGTGYNLDNEDDWQELEVIDTPEARAADFAVEVDGRSMEPTFYDGDIVYVVMSPDVPVGKVGLFRQNGNGYIKEAGEDFLRSVNRDFPDIYPKDGEIDVIGMVIGKAKLPE